jgi:hypothetical protein
VINESLELDRPQRTYSQSSKGALSGAGLGKSNSAASKALSEGKIERSASAASSRGSSPYDAGRDVGKSYFGPSAVVTHERSYSVGSRAPSSFYSQPSVVDYSIGGNPYAQFPRNPYT